MRARSLLLATTLTAAMAAMPLTAHADAKEKVNLDRAMFDSTVDRTAVSLHMSGATRGELGGYLDVTLQARDNSLPTGSNSCENAIVSAVLTVAPGETLYTQVKGEICTGFFGDNYTVNAYFDKDDLEYDGKAHKKAKVVGDGLIAASYSAFFGGQASFSATVKW